MDKTPKRYEPYQAITKSQLQRQDESNTVYNKPQPDRTLAIVGLIATILGIFPGLWAIIAGPKYRTQGIVQLALYIVGLATIFAFVGIFIALPIWIWSIVTMALIVGDSGKAK